MTTEKRSWKEKIKPYEGIIYFIVILFVSHFFWKFTVKGDESDSVVTFFGLNISAPFIYMAKHFADIIASILQFFGSDVMLAGNNVLYYGNENAIRIVWGCTGIKQAYIFFCIIAFTRGPWTRKLWYIPLGMIVIYLFNLFRMVIIVALYENHTEWFNFLHAYLFKYLFYGVIFLLWMLWDEKIALKKRFFQSKSVS